MEGPLGYSDVMIFWVLAAFLTAGVTIALLAPLRGHADDDAPGDHDIEVYGDQLAEIERDHAAGLIDKQEMEYARAEIGRRLLRARHADESGARTKKASPARMANAARIAIVAGVPLVGLGTYLATGAPNMPDQPLAARSNPETDGASGVASMIAQAERHLEDNPEDGRGWDVLAPIYLRIGELDDARTAYLNAIRLLGPSAARQSGYGETLVARADGVVTQEARVAFQSARELQPDEPKAAFYLALALKQEGREDRALADFRQLAERSPSDAPWMAAVNAQISELGSRVADLNASGLPPLALLPQADGEMTADESAEPAVPGPTEADIEAARDMSADDRQQMIEAMVTSLDQRLRDDPDNIEGWVRLVRSYGVLGRPEAASDALARGLEVFPDDSEDRAALMTVARQLGLDEPGAEGIQ